MSKRGAFKGRRKDNSGKRKFAKKPVQPVQPKQETNSDEIRLNKYIANSGVCSRREADMHISIGSVSVNGKIITEMGYKVKPGDEVRFDGARITPERKTYVLLNKPKGFATTTSSSKGRTVMDLVANATNAKIKPIGRLGRSATGLLLFTNDDEVVKKFKKSKQGVAKLFHVELNKNIKADDFKAIRDGLRIGKNIIEIEEISHIDNAPKTELGIRIKNMSNAVIRQIFDHLKYEIVRLDCVMIGPLTKKDLPRGHWKHLTENEVSQLMML
ncbi:MAG: rRNA pseudouridine synthase [Flavobacteriaceae bacterium]|nr:rRNA pseudouridine synthase [Bacteroidia bacterium]NNK70754.1 rRNA pseudouridine synthase [Flavobacteriaceae bacterium]